jgi:Tfp pilus assembly protein PilV
LKHLIHSEEGLSLLEVVVSLLLITTILLSFFGLFIQSKKTGITSEEMVDATYLAQQEMEDIYLISRQSFLDKAEADLSALNYRLTDTQSLACAQPASKDYDHYSAVKAFSKTSGPYVIETAISSVCGFDYLANVSINVYEASILKSSVENMYLWRMRN